MEKEGVEASLAIVGASPESHLMPPLRHSARSTWSTPVAVETTHCRDVIGIDGREAIVENEAAEEKGAEAWRKEEFWRWRRDLMEEMICECA